MASCRILPCASVIFNTFSSKLLVNRIILSKKKNPCLLYKGNFLKVHNMSTDHKKVPLATFDEVKALKADESVLLIDVREPEELKETGVLPGSINIPLGQVEDVLKNMPAEEFQDRFGRPKPTSNFPLVFSCKSGKRSESASQTALKLGYNNVRNYIGGWLDWEEKIKQ